LQIAAESVFKKTLAKQKGHFPKANGEMPKSSGAVFTTLALFKLY
jgi:hypothetical protein